jgi:hypothetical protein
MKEYPDLIVKKGIGIFTSPSYNFESPFVITNYPGKTIIEADIQNGSKLLKAYLSDNNWNLSGQINSGISIKANDLLITTINNRLIFEPLTEVKFGAINAEKFSFAEFPLIGYYEGEIDLNINNWQIKSLDHHSEVSLKSIIGKRWNLQL